MRTWPFIFLFWALGVLAADRPDALGTARQLASSGAYRLALDRVEQSQPPDAGGLRWAEWEALRLRLLSRLDRHADVLARAAALSASMPAEPLRECLALAARAAVATSQGSLARRYTARILWQLAPPSDVAKKIRLLVIESYVADRKGDDAFRSMLRFQQDYQPLDRNTATRFVEALLDLDMAREAVNWFGSLDDAGPVKLLLRLRTGLISADAAVARARSKLVKANSAGFWRVLFQAGVQRRDRALQIEALENMLQLGDAGNMRRLTTQARRLWQLYFDAAQEIGNQQQLLTGDDARWMDFAARRLGASPALARSFFAQLAQRGQTLETRRSAELQLVQSLSAGRLDLAALRLFQHADPGAGDPDSQTRYLLGAIAESRNLAETALGFWEGLDPPAGVADEEWRLRVAEVAVHAGRIDRGAAALKDILSVGKKLTGPPAQRSVALVQEILDAGKLDLAEDLFEALLPLVDAPQSRAVLFGLGRIHEITGQSPVAADYYLRAALLDAAAVPDAMTLRARLFAAINLMRAGYTNDARTQFEWLIKNSKDAAQLDIARRALSRL